MTTAAESYTAERSAHRDMLLLRPAIDCGRLNRGRHRAGLRQQVGARMIFKFDVTLFLQEVRIEADTEAEARVKMAEDMTPMDLIEHAVSAGIVEEPVRT